jgi:hypothetical protein
MKTPTPCILRLHVLDPASGRQQLRHGGGDDGSAAQRARRVRAQPFVDASRMEQVPARRQPPHGLADLQEAQADGALRPPRRGGVVPLVHERRRERRDRRRAHSSRPNESAAVGVVSRAAAGRYVQEGEVAGDPDAVEEGDGDDEEEGHDSRRRADAEELVGDEEQECGDEEQGEEHARLVASSVVARRRGGGRVAAEQHGVGGEHAGARGVEASAVCCAGFGELLWIVAQLTHVAQRGG